MLYDNRPISKGRQRAYRFFLCCEVYHIPTDIITKKEVDIGGIRTSDGEFAEAIELIHSGKVYVKRILTILVNMKDAPDTIADIEKIWEIT